MHVFNKYNKKFSISSLCPDSTDQLFISTPSCKITSILLNADI